VQPDSRLKVARDYFVGRKILCTEVAGKIGGVRRKWVKKRGLLAE